MGLNLSLNQLAEIVGADPAYADITVTGSAIDTRQVKPGDVFIALKGERVDGHEFIAQAREAGASAALVTEIQDDALPQIKVANARKAFADIAHAWQQQCDAKVIAITGSNGKTSVKEMISAILRQVGTVTATQGNLNNELGVPLTLSRLSETDQFAVIEMGTNHHGEIAELVKIATPDVAVINNIGEAHLEGFGSVDGIAKEKGEIYAGLANEGIAVVNADMPYQRLWQPLIANRKTVSFSLESEADIKADYIQLDPASSHFLVNIDDVSHHFNLPLPGMHNVNNALAAIALAVALKVPVDAMVKGLSTMQSVPHRLQVRHAVSGSRLIDDTYNANPGSYLQALNTLSAFRGEHWLVLGDFGELGIDNDKIHQQMGQQARESGVTRLMTVGVSSKIAAQSFGDGAVHYEDIGVLQQELLNELNEGVTCLIKGSRFMQLDKLADQLAQEGEG